MRSMFMTSPVLSKTRAPPQLARQNADASLGKIRAATTVAHDDDEARERGCGDLRRRPERAGRVRRVRALDAAEGMVEVAARDEVRDEQALAREIRAVLGDHGVTRGV